MSPHELVAQALEHLVLVTGLSEWRIAASGTVDGHRWTWREGEPGPHQPVIDWDIHVVATCGEYTGQVEANSGQEIEDDGSPVVGHAAIEVLAWRTQTSTVLGLAAGLAAYKLYSGEFSGVGVERCVWPDQYDTVVARFVPPHPTDDVEAALLRLGALLGASTMSV